MLKEEQEMEAEKPPFLERIKNFFSSSKEGEEEATYDRKLLDSRIEKYLDKHADEYIAEFGLVTSIDLDKYDERYDALTGRISSLQEYVKGTDADLSDLERRLKTVKTASKKKK